MVRESELREVVNSLLDSAARSDSPLELEEPLELGTQFPDSTRVGLNIHYPTDWVLPRDAVRTLMKATVLIRKRGSKARKKTSRRMRRQVKSAAAHARRHGDLLENRRSRADRSRAKAR